MEKSSYRHSAKGRQVRIRQLPDEKSHFKHAERDFHVAPLLRMTMFFFWYSAKARLQN